jgi:tetratricopeptide (TPR) repeat protein
VLTNLPPGTGTAAPAVDPEAYNNYLKGRYFWNKRSTDSLFKAIDYFQEAIAKDPAYAAAYAGVADSYNLLGSSGYAALRPKEAFPKAIAAAQKALEIDSNSAEAHVSLGYARMVYNWDLPAAQREFQRALELNPAYPTAHQFYAYYLIAAGRESEAIAEDQKAQELDPLSPVITSALGETYYFTRQFDRMVEEDRKAVELDATFGLGLFNLGRAYGRKGLHDQAITTYNQALSRAPDDPLLLAAVAYEHAVAGQREQASKIIAKLQTIANTRYVPALYVGAIYLALGDKPHAMEYLAQAYEERCDYFIYLRRDPMADPMRNDPAFVGLLQKTGLAQ